MSEAMTAQCSAPPSEPAKRAFFLVSAKGLIERGYTEAGRIAISGGSAGGEGSSYAVGAIFEKGKAPEKVEGDLAAILIERARRLAQERAAQA